MVGKPARKYKTILNWEVFDQLLSNLKSAGEFSVDLETTSLHPIQANIVGISFTFKDHEAYYIPLAHRYIGAPDQLDYMNMITNMLI